MVEELNVDPDGGLSITAGPVVGAGVGVAVGVGVGELIEYCSIRV